MAMVECGRAVVTETREGVFCASVGLIGEPRVVLIRNGKAETVAAQSYMALWSKNSRFFHYDCCPDLLEQDDAVM